MNSYILNVFPDLEALSQWALQKIFEVSMEAVAARGRFLLVLNGGSTPSRLFELLGNTEIDRIEWGRTHIFWGDERCVPPEDPESNYKQARGLFLSHLSIPEGHIHRIEGELDPVRAASKYLHLLNHFSSPPLAWPKFDLVLLGMGEDGHTASLFPGSPVAMPEGVLAVNGNYQNRPAQRITMTPSLFNDARLILFMVAGENKAEVLKSVLSQNSDPELYPVQRIHPKDGTVIWLADHAAANLVSN